MAQLQIALTTSTALTEPAIIKLVQGTYLLSADLDFGLIAPTVLDGGYMAQCATRQVNPANTVIDGQAHRISLKQ